MFTITYGITDTVKCCDCEEMVPEDETSFCEVCGEPVCTKCAECTSGYLLCSYCYENSEVCYICNQLGVRDSMVECIACGHHVHEDCSTEDKLCLNCAEEKAVCPTCYEIVYRDDMWECKACGKEACIDCLNDEDLCKECIGAMSVVQEQ